MSGKRRAYPQPQYMNTAGAGAAAGGNQFPPAGSPQLPPQQGYPAFQQPQQQYQGSIGGVAPAFGVDQMNQQFGNLNVAGGQNYPSAPAPGSNNVYQASQYPEQVPQYGQQPLYGQQPAYGQADPYSGYQQAQYGQQSSMFGALGGGAALPMNQLYTTDLSRELPPSIPDLSLPPPPLVLPPNAKLIPSSETANASPDYFRSTLNVFPTTHSLAKKSKLPTALIVRPFNSLKYEDEDVPVALDTIISRCRRCRGYINPFITLTEQGRRWRCNFCNLQNDIPSAFEYDEYTGTAKNKFDRPELNNAVIDFVAPKEYMARSPQPIVYAFIIDVSIDAINSGLTSTVTRTILESLDRIPNQNKTARVAFIGVDSSLHYFKFQEGVDDTELLIISDIDSAFLPSPEGLLVNLYEHRSAIEKLLVDFPTFFEGNANPRFALGPALRAAHRLISNIGGKLVCFSSTLPDVGEGKLSLRDEATHSGKMKESQMLLSNADKFYKSFAVDCNSAQITVDLFLTSARYQDVASLSNLPCYTGGQAHFYPAWTCAKSEDVTKLSKEVSDHLSMEIALEAVLRVRGSTGVRMSSFFGHFFNRSSDLCSFPTFPRDQSYCIEISIEENITKPVLFFQAAVLHSTCFGERRIRVMNLAIPTSSKLSDVYASADQLAMTNYFTHRAVELAFSSSLFSAREFLVKSIVDILNVYRKELVGGNVAGASPLQVSTNLRMLPLLLFSLTKHLGLRNERVPSDHRAAALNALRSLPLPHLIKYIYPTVYSLHNMGDDCGFLEQVVGVDEGTGEEVTINTGNTVLPEPINDTRTSWENYGLYLIDNSCELFLWVSGDVVPGLVYDLFGTENLYSIPTGKTELPELTLEDSEFNYKVRQIIGAIREQKDSVTWKNLYVVIGGSSNEPIEISQQRDLIALRMWALSCLVEDKTASEPGYREFLASLKTKIAP